MMNKISKFSKLSLFVIFILVSACNEEKLALYPYDELTVDKVYADLNGAEAALLGIYDKLPWYYKYTHFWFADTYGDNHMFMGGDNPMHQTIAEGNPEPTMRVFGEYWGKSYEFIGLANAFLENIEFADISNQHRKNQMIGEAHFFRALFYFKLSQMFGEVPLVLNQVSGLNDPLMYPEKVSLEQIFQQVISDAKIAEAALPPKNTDIKFNNEYARPTKEATQALLAEIYLSAPEGIKNYVLAASYASAVRNSNAFSLLPDYDQLWEYDNKKNDEFVFQIIMSAVGVQNGGNITGLSYEGAGTVWFRPTIESYVMYKEGDIRRNANMYQGEFKNGTPFYQNKYRSVTLNWNNQNYNVYEYRLGGVLLLEAEALARDSYKNVKDVLNLVDMVRKRAYGYLLNTSDPRYPEQTFQSLSLEDYPDKESLISLVLDERQKELYFEAKRYWDLKRNSKASEVLGLDEYKLRWPIPQNEIDKNINLIQNIGY